MKRWLLVIDIVAALILLTGVAGAAVVLTNRDTGPKPSPFPTAALTQSPSPSPVASPSKTGGPAPQPANLGDWPTYGYNDARTRFNPAIDLRPPYRLKWKFGVGDLIEFPPSIVDGELYFCSQHGYVYSLRAKDKHVRWRYHLRHALFASTPTVDATSVYVTSFAGKLIVLDRKTGKVRWMVSGIGATESSPLVWKGRVFFGSQDGNVYAIDIRTHKIAWRYQTGGAVKGAPAQLNGRIVIGSYNGSVYCLSWGGHLYWRHSTGGILGSSEEFYATPALAYNTAYIGGTGGHIYAFDLGNGGTRWSFSTGGYVYSSPAVWRYLVFEGGYDHYFYALNAANGRLVWRFYAGGPISGSPTVLNGIVYVSSLRRHTWGLDVRTGRVVWQFPDGKYTPVTADKKTLYLCGALKLYALVPKHK
ncbi:MAG TPA: PQQ-binding-like beta-propeller repeat protein [Thermoleophilia bacterium]|nr:PQQ-binding-like beta-propeller repeat protein [Thermoleophilia bacterium]